MYVVIFQATVAITDEESYREYSTTAVRLRDMALNRFGCLNFVAMMEGDQELALSWWPDEASIRRWKAEADHTMAQKLGRKQWYNGYKVEVAKIERQYEVPAKATQSY
ncbi:antibiotic biosynthesis monooxygenase family protein [Sansalvadorimonas verongulae]|uniref:antibiotic biosynthesis monooxygenase family protein n=1 Tax=Sansalvadorimonas verongulae TaxID=2172824 RepID=UPI0012BC9A5F|nr:antibiotic biosynthesis monooxygenase [Sansalvadorimonas verongulae]MTI12661.1 antibiotic biosynthesis monooxygenase [Sansalvadorimonas verongulae]